jgi:hypothetical protein
MFKYDDPETLLDYNDPMTVTLIRYCILDCILDFADRYRGGAGPSRQPVRQQPLASHQRRSQRHKLLPDADAEVNEVRKILGDAKLKAVGVKRQLGSTERSVRYAKRKIRERTSDNVRSVGNVKWVGMANKKQVMNCNADANNNNSDIENTNNSKGRGKIISRSCTVTLCERVRQYVRDHAIDLLFVGAIGTCMYLACTRNAATTDAITNPNEQTVWDTIERLVTAQQTSTTPEPRFDPYEIDPEFMSMAGSGNASNSPRHRRYSIINKFWSKHAFLSGKEATQKKEFMTELKSSLKDIELAHGVTDSKCPDLLVKHVAATIQEMTESYIKGIKVPSQIEKGNGDILAPILFRKTNDPLTKTCQTVLFQWFNQVKNTEGMTDANFAKQKAGIRENMVAVALHQLGYVSREAPLQRLPPSIPPPKVPPKIPPTSPGSLKMFLHIMSHTALLVLSVSLLASGTIGIVKRIRNYIRLRKIAKDIVKNLPEIVEKLEDEGLIKNDITTGVVDKKKKNALVVLNTTSTAVVPVARHPIQRKT